jgi:hypothetical protein
MKLTTLSHADPFCNTIVTKKQVVMWHVIAVALAAQVIPNIASAQPVGQPATPLSGVLGKITSFTGSSLDVATPSGVVHVKVTWPIATYKLIPSDLSQVASDSYVGVASVQQADGAELAKQVIIFPRELRGAAEGSVLLDAPNAAAHNRMTNGSVATHAVSHSRMTNGTVRKGGSSSLLVRYQGGSQTISIPAGVPVTLVAKETVTLRPGDTIYAATSKLPDGSLTTNKIFQFVAAK